MGETPNPTGVQRAAQLLPDCRGLSNSHRRLSSARRGKVKKKPVEARSNQLPRAFQLSPDVEDCRTRAGLSRAVQLPPDCRSPSNFRQSIKGHPTPAGSSRTVQLPPDCPGSSNSHRIINILPLFLETSPLSLRSFLDVWGRFVGNNKG